MDTRFAIGRLLIFSGVVMSLIGLALMYMERIPLIGHLPGDLSFHGKSWSLHLPLASGLVLSLLLTLLLNFFLRR